MRQVLLRSIALLRRPWVIVGITLLTGGGVALVFLPLFGVPGYEISEALTLAIGLIAGGLGIAAAFQERRLIQGRDPRPKNALRSDSAMKSALVAMAAAFLLAAVAIIPPLLASVIYAFSSTRCDPFALIGFFPLLTLPSALLASALGMLAGFAVRRGWIAYLIYFGVVVASLVITVWPILAGPQVFAFNHFLGYLPGPLYDEALSIKPALWWFRLETLLLSGFVWLLTALLLDMRDGDLTRPHLRPGSGVLLAAFVFGIFLIEERAPTIGLRMSDSELQERLGASTSSEHFEVYYWRGKDRLAVQRFLRDLEFRHAQMARFLGAPDQKIRVYLYRSGDEKDELVGASRTQFAKPWRYEVHLNEAGFPHPVLKHELAHIMAAPYGSGPFRISARLGLWPVMGVIEGMAVALDNPVNDLTLHQWAAGMRKQSLAPDVREILKPTGFYAQAAARAYTVAGSFLRYLGETYGAEKLQALYARADFQDAYGKSLSELASEWERFLDQLPVDDAAVNQAFARFRQGSVFARSCAREVANLQQLAAQALVSDPEEALVLYRRCSELQPEEPAFALGQARALSELDREKDADDTLRAMAMLVDGKPALEAEVLLARADVAWKQGDKAQVVQFLEKVASLETSPAIDRTAHVKLEAARSDKVGTALWAYFQRGQEDVRLLRLREALTRDPENPYVSYLLGRRLSQAQEPELAQPYLAQAIASELPDSIRKEALNLAIETAYLAGDCNGVRHQAGALPDLGAAYSALAQQWVERCAFEEQVFKGPLAPKDPFR